MRNTFAALVLAAQVLGGCEPPNCGEDLDYDARRHLCVCQAGFAIVRDGGACEPVDAGSDAAVDTRGDSCAAVPEMCNGIDDDCDGIIDGLGAACGPTPRATTTVCRAGECAVVGCEPGSQDCDGTFANGCEALVAQDVGNCGACGVVCTAAETCASSVCTTLPIGNWFVRAASSATDDLTDLAIDGMGNVYVVGTLAATGQVGTEEVSGTIGHSTLFVGAIGRDGRTRWAQPIRASRGSNGLHIVTDASGNAYIVGDYDGELYFTGQRHTAATRRQFIASFSSTGAERWMVEVNGASIADMAADARGDIAVAGSFTTSATIGSRPITASGTAGFVAVMDSADRIRWTYVLESSRIDTVDAAGDGLVVVASIGSGIEFGSTTTVVGGAYAGTFDATGVALRLVPLPALPAKVAVHDDVLIIGGEFSGSLTVGSSTIDSTSFGSAYLAAIGLDGVGRWAVTAATAQNRAAAGEISIDEHGNSYVILGTSGAFADVAGSNYLSTGSFQSFVASFDAMGRSRWVQSLGDSVVRGRAIDARESTVLLGATAPSLGLLGLTSPGAGAQDGFIISLRGR